MRALIASVLCALLCSCTADVTRRDRPLTLAEAKRELDFPFPSSAHDIYYATYHDLLAPYEFVLRFDAPPADCVATVQKALEWHEQTTKMPTKYETVQLTAVTPLPSSSYLYPVKWWDDTVIHQGFFAGEDSSHTPTIWVDSQLGRFYYRVTD